MNLSLTRILCIVLGAILLIAAVFFGIDAMRSTDWVKGVFALVGIAVGFVLITGQGIHLSA